MGHALTIDLPNEVYEQLRQTAEKEQRTPEEGAAEWLARALLQLNGNASLAAASLRPEPVKPLQAVEFSTRLSASGTLPIPTLVCHALQLRSGVEVEVVLLRAEETPEDKARLAAEREAMWQRLEAIREKFAGLDVNLTDALLEARAEDRAHEGAL
jgi:hypothetical protein